MLIKVKLNLFKKTKDRSEKLLKKLYNFIPCVFTFLNAIFGFISILKSFDDDYRIAAACIAIAGLMDLADGKIARALGLCSYFGMELDSLSDAISFCLAPTILLYCWMAYTSLNIWHLLVLFFYLCAGIARLAKFNINAANSLNCKTNSNSYFIGLPTTVAALFIISMVLTFDNVLFADNLYKDFLVLLILIISILMISNLKFKSIKNIRLLKPSAILFIIFNSLIIYLFGFGFLFLEFILYIIFNVINDFRLLTGKKV